MRLLLRFLCLFVSTCNSERVENLGMTVTETFPVETTGHQERTRNLGTVRPKTEIEKFTEAAEKFTSGTNQFLSGIEKFSESIEKLTTAIDRFGERGDKFVRKFDTFIEETAKHQGYREFLSEESDQKLKDYQQFLREREDITNGKDDIVETTETLVEKVKKFKEEIELMGKVSETETPARQMEQEDVKHIPEAIQGESDANWAVISQQFVKENENSLTDSKQITTTTETYKAREIVTTGITTLSPRTKILEDMEQDETTEFENVTVKSEIFTTEEQHENFTAQRISDNDNEEAESDQIEVRTEMTVENNTMSIKNFQNQARESKNLENSEQAIVKPENFGVSDNFIRKNKTVTEEIEAHKEETKACIERNNSSVDLTKLKPESEKLTNTSLTETAETGGLLRNAVELTKPIENIAIGTGKRREQLVQTTERNIIKPVNTFTLETLNQSTDEVTKAPTYISTQNFTHLERMALLKFRPIVNHLLVDEYQKSDAYLINWLRAKNLDIPSAVSMLRVAHQWRKVYNMDGITKEIIFDFNPPPHFLSGFDREGRPVIILTPTSVDIRGLILQGARTKAFRYVFQVVEQGLEKRFQASKMFGKEITQVDVLGDFNGFNLRQHGCLPCIPMFRDMFIAFENYYPGVIRHLIVINVPRAALPLIEIVKPLLSPGTAKALRIFGTNRVEWTNFLTKIISPNQLPYRFGGTKMIRA